MNFSSRTARRCSAGLTLIDVIVATVVVAVALALLLALLAQERSRGHRIRCVSHLKQLGIAFRGYGIDMKAYPMQLPVTNGGVASWFTTFGTFDPKLRHKGITCFVVDASMPGVKIGKKENKMGQRASLTNDVIFEDVRVPKANVVGEEGAGFKVAMKTFDRSRPWIAALMR